MGLPVTSLEARVPFALAASGTVTDATVESDAFRNWFHKGCLIVVNRTAETGACTLAVKLQGQVQDGTGSWFDVANADVVTFADSATGIRYALVYPGITGSDADGVVAQDTNFNLVNGFLPFIWRIAVTHGGTSVENTFSVTVHPYP